MQTQTLNHDGILVATGGHSGGSCSCRYSCRCNGDDNEISTYLGTHTAHPTSTNPACKKRLLARSFGPRIPEPCTAQVQNHTLTYTTAATQPSLMEPSEILCNVETHSGCDLGHDFPRYVHLPLDLVV